MRTRLHIPALLTGLAIGCGLLIGVGTLTDTFDTRFAADSNESRNSDDPSSAGNRENSRNSGRDMSDDASAGKDTFTVNVTGDLLWHPVVYESGMRPDGSFDYTEVFEDIKPTIESADVAICHEEVPFAAPEGPFSGYPAFQAPPQIAPYIKATGWDMCTAVSNHSVDFGPEGLFRTLDALDAAGLVHSGSARSPEEAEQPRIFTAENGVSVAVVTGTYGTNGIPVEQPWMVNDLNPDTLLARAAAARSAGADIVMVAMHAGEENVAEPTQQQVELANILTQSPDIDVVYGHHIHAVQPIEKVNGKWVVYGLGNHIANQVSNDTTAYEGISVNFEFAPINPSESPNFTTNGAWKVDSLTVIPTIVTPPGVSPVKTAPISDLMARPGADTARLQAALDRTRSVIYMRGANNDPELSER
ncbi:CapA family protein [Corynebacterium sp. H113]|uniref:CapA family protein n=1 Tax=Corynebacterium sp. H113 TaxID=3133419 RepID=UPI0030B7ED92